MSNLVPTGLAGHGEDSEEPAQGTHAMLGATGPSEAGALKILLPLPLPSPLSSLPLISQSWPFLLPDMMLAPVKSRTTTGT